MKPVLSYLLHLLGGLLLLLPHTLHGEEFAALFNGNDLDGWDRYLGTPTVPTLPFEWFIKRENILGFNRDDQAVFSIKTVDNTPAIRISGEIWGALISHEEFSNYHLRLEYKWGDLKFPPRDEKPRNSGILYHSYGEAGSFWGYWMKSVEFEIMENATGDICAVGGVEALIPSARDFQLPYPWLKYLNNGEPKALKGLSFRFSANPNSEYPSGEWNTLEIITKNSASWHFVNGVLVMAASEIRNDQGHPLNKGKIQLQSEGAEIFFRKVAIKNLKDQDLTTIDTYVRSVASQYRTAQ